MFTNELSDDGQAVMTSLRGLINDMKHPEARSMMHSEANDVEYDMIAVEAKRGLLDQVPESMRDIAAEVVANEAVAAGMLAVNLSALAAKYKDIEPAEDEEDDEDDEVAALIHALLGEFGS